MDSFYVPREPSFLKFNPLTLLAQISGQKTSGCLVIYSGSDSWKLYLEEGELVYASAVRQAFDRLERHLRQMGRMIPSLVSAVRVQVRLLFETRQALPSALSADYQAIQWLLDQQYLTQEQAVGLVENLAQESLRSLLLISTGSYEIIDRNQIQDWFSVCRLDLRHLLEVCANSQIEKPSTQLEGGDASSVLPFATVHQSASQSPFMQSSRGQSSLVQPSVADPVAAPMHPSQLSSVSSYAAPGSAFALRGTAASTARTERYRVVCVDDSPSILKLIHSYLEEEDFSVFMINDPVRALMQVVRCKPDLVLLDVEMPNLDGYELCSLLRRHPAFKAIPIVMVTGNTGFLDRARAKLVGASGYLTKPFNRSELLKIVFRNLSV